MTADNSFIADQFSLLSKLMYIHGENSFKAKSYSSAAFTIDKLPQQLAEISADKYASIKGIGDFAAKKYSQEAMIAGDIPECLGEAFQLVNS